jgi:hypothetical protein
VKYFLSLALAECLDFNGFVTLLLESLEFGVFSDLFGLDLKFSYESSE